MQIRTLDRTLAILATLAALTVAAMVFILSAVLFFSQAKPPTARSQ
jgi:hypothetical protein